MKHIREMAEGPEAFERFRGAVKTILSVRKHDVAPNQPKAEQKKKRPAPRRG